MAAVVVRSTTPTLATTTSSTTTPEPPLTTADPASPPTAILAPDTPEPGQASTLAPNITSCAVADVPVSSIAIPPPDSTPVESYENDVGCRIYVGHLTSQANETDLQAFFRPFGVIRHIWIARKPPGFAFVTYSKADAAQRAINAVTGMENPCILGQSITCQLSRDGAGATTERPSASLAPRTRVRKRKGETFRQRKERKLKAIEASSSSGHSSHYH